MKRKDVARIARHRTDKPTDRYAFGTLTAPGQGVLPWDRSKCSHGAEVRCSGEAGCRVDEQELARWHGSLAQRWSWFMTTFRRKLGCDVQFMKTYEAQKRGALHIHSMIRVNGAVTHERARQVWAECAAEWGFGTEVDYQSINGADARETARKAGYVAKYAAKNADALPEVARVDLATGEMTRGGFRPWSASRRWGITMRQIAMERRTWALAEDGGRAALPPPPPEPLDLETDFYTEPPP